MSLYSEMSSDEDICSIDESNQLEDSDSELEKSHSKKKKYDQNLNQSNFKEFLFFRYIKIIFQLYQNIFSSIHFNRFN